MHTIHPPSHQPLSHAVQPRPGAARPGLMPVMMLLLITVALLFIAPLTGCDGPEISIRETPIKIISDREGFGSEAVDGRMVTVSYEVQSESGQTLLRDSNFRFVLGRGAVIRGIDEAVPGMRVGGTRVFECPPHKHWGRAGYGNGAIPPNTNLIIRLTLNRVEDTPALAGAGTTRSTR